MNKLCTQTVVIGIEKNFKMSYTGSQVGVERTQMQLSVELRPLFLSLSHLLVYLLFSH